MRKKKLKSSKEVQSVYSKRTKSIFYKSFILSFKDYLRDFSGDSLKEKELDSKIEYFGDLIEKRDYTRKTDSNGEAYYDYNMELN